MPDNKQDLIDHNLQDLNEDGVDRRGFLKCMAWAGTGLVWTMSGGIPVSRAFAKGYGEDAGKGADFTFVQISDSHIGFNKPANPDVTATLQTAINKINAMPHKPDFIIHTGDLTQLSKPSEFDTLDQALKGASAKQIYFVPGEHDMLSDNGEEFLQMCIRDRDFSKTEITRGGKKITFTPMEFKTMEFLAKNAQRVISREELLNEVWGYQNYPYTRTVDNHMLKLRQKLESDPSHPLHLSLIHI